MTRFSVVVPMRSTEAFADECLWSVRRQTGADVEVIAVDDDSPDECGAIADRHARADDRLTVVHLARSHGVGPARNAGIARASGDYVLFLDADDAFFDHRVLADLDAVLAATGDPDVLLFDYEEWRPCGLRRRMGLERSSRSTRPASSPPPSIPACCARRGCAGTRPIAGSSSPLPGCGSRPGTTRTSPGRSPPCSRRRGSRCRSGSGCATGNAGPGAPVAR